MRTTVVRVAPREAQDSGGSACLATVSVEWAPEPASSIPIKSSWRDPIGHLLTNRRIAQRAREGYYGEAARVRELERSAKRPVHCDMVFRCPCGSTDVRYYRWSYLPKAGYYCEHCRAAYRGNVERETRLNRELTQRVKQQIMERYV